MPDFELTWSVKYIMGTYMSTMNLKKREKANSFNKGSFNDMSRWQKIVIKRIRF